MLVDTLIILFGYLVLVFVVKSSSSYDFYCIFHTCIYGLFQYFKNLQVNSFIMLLPIIATYR